MDLDGGRVHLGISILRISHSYYSRVSNAYVIQKMGCERMSTMLLRRQLLFFGKVARLDSNSVIRAFVFQPNTVQIVKHPYRKRGRPRAEWPHELAKICHSSFDTWQAFENCIHDQSSWQAWIRSKSEFLP